jgi:prepilin-type processing-associated H-X9-DG protein
MKRRAFTLVELLVVIGTIAVLVGLLLPSLAAARRSAKSVRCASDVHQMLLAYQMYYQQNDGGLMYGYPNATVNGVTLYVEVPGVGSVSGITAQRYPWRIVPFFDGVWPVLHGYEDLPTDPYMLGVAPAIGINAVFMGGHKDYAGYVLNPATGATDRPNKGKHVAFSASDIKRAAEQIVFVETQVYGESSATDDKRGLHFVIPPRANGQHWHVTSGKFVVDTPDIIIGLPQGRYGDRANVGFFDGHVAAMLPGELTDMRLWAKDAKSADYDYVP